MERAGLWAGVMEPQPVREAKPRQVGVTMVIDKGMPPDTLADWLSVAGPYVDVVKLGFGTGLLYEPATLQRKLALLRAADILVCPGGTLLEIAWKQGRADPFIECLARLGFTALEVSDGTASVPPEARRTLIKTGQRYGLRVLAEVGKKDPRQAPEPAALRAQVVADLEAGAWKVIVEARDSGRGVGIFDAQGELNRRTMEAVSADIDGDLLIWEAPQPHQQVALLKLLGPEANLGNVAPADVVALEASRRGLRSDTWALLLAEGAAMNGAARAKARV